MLINEVKEKIEDLYDWVWATGYDCEECPNKTLVHEPHGEVTRHCNVENSYMECPVVEDVILGNRIVGNK